MGNENNKKVTTVVVTYNRKELLRENISALKKQKYKDNKVIIVDNASTDGTYDYIKDELNENVLYFNTGVNLGGAGGFNFGIKKAVQLGCDYVWIMDDDCIVQEESLTELVKFAKDKQDNFGFLSSKVLWTDGTLCNMNIQRVNLSKEIKNKDVNQKICLASFVSLFINVSAVYKVGLPIKDFFIWGDDWEYTYRISKKYDCFFVPASVVVHKCKNNMGVNIVKDESDRLDRYFYAYRNEGYFYNRCGIKGKLYFLMKQNLHKLKLRFTKTTNKKKKLHILKDGLKAVKTFKPQIEYIHDKNNKLKVLEFFGEPLAYGGQEAFMYNMYKNFDASNIEYTLCTPFYLTNKNLIDIAENRNEKIIHYDYKFNSKLRKLFIKKSIKKALKQNNYDVVHIHSGSVWVLLVTSRIAKRNNVKKVIVHAHSLSGMGIKNKFIKYISDKFIKKYVDKFLACSVPAASSKFPKSIIDRNEFEVIKNGIDVENFKFNNEKRVDYRQKLNINDEVVLLHVGRFDQYKNQDFLVDIATKLKEISFKFKFILVGEGELKNKIIQRVSKEKLNNYFTFLEKRSDIAEIMMASDIFLFPSIIEGLGIVAIESQCSGLHTICSDNIPSETNITDRITYLCLDKQDAWIDKIVGLGKNDTSRELYYKEIEKMGYAAKYSADILERIYEK